MQKKTPVRNGLLFIFSLLVSLEVAGYLSKYPMPRLYDQSALILTELENSKDRLPEFMRTNYSPTTGWTSARVKDDIGGSCLGGRRKVTIGKRGERPYTGYVPEKVTVLLTGDSYAFGSELNDDEAIASQMFKKTGVMTANLAVGAYDPLQAYLHVKEKRPDFPHAKVVILMIMYEDVDRMMSSYRAVQAKRTAVTFGFKPYMKDGAIQKLEPEIFQSYETMKQAAIKATKDDYWARPRHTFPYSLSLFRAVTGNYFIHKIVNTIMGPFGRYYLWSYYSDVMASNLFSLVKEYAAWAESENLKPIVLFVPSNAFDVLSPQIWIDRYQQQFPPNLLIKNLDFSGIDPQRYNNKPDGNCHPSPYGARAIARQALQMLEEAQKPSK